MTTRALQLAVRLTLLLSFLCGSDSLAFHEKMPIKGHRLLDTNSGAMLEKNSVLRSIS
jgi:hypothetical protein